MKVTVWYIINSLKKDYTPGYRFTKKTYTKHKVKDIFWILFTAKKQILSSKVKTDFKQ